MASLKTWAQRMLLRAKARWSRDPRSRVLATCALAGLTSGVAPLGLSDAAAQCGLHAAAEARARALAALSEGGAMAETTYTDEQRAEQMARVKESIAQIKEFERKIQVESEHS